MKQLLLLSSIVITNAIFSQGITLTSIDFANGGDTVRMSQTTDPTIDFTSSGADYSWDFSNLSANSQIVKNFRSMSAAPAFVQLLFGPFAQTKYQASYYIESTALPIAQLSSFLPVSIDNLFAFTRRSSDSLTSIGYSMVVSGTDVPFKSDTIETRYDFPLNFDDIHVSRGYTFVDFNPILDAKWKQHRTRTTQVDGYGNIVTPYGSFDVLRIKHDINEVDSLYYTFPFIGATWIPIPIPSSHEYEWWTNGEKEPILRIVTNDILGNETVTSIEYRDIDRNLDAGIEELEIEMNMYPNPVKDVLHIQADLQVSQIDVTDQLGNIVSSQELIPADELFLDVSKLAAGTYIVNVYAGSIKATQLFVKQ